MIMLLFFLIMFSINILFIEKLIYIFKYRKINVFISLYTHIINMNNLYTNSLKQNTVLEMFQKIFDKFAYIICFVCILDYIFLILKILILFLLIIFLIFFRN